MSLRAAAYLRCAHLQQQLQIMEAHWFSDRAQLIDQLTEPGSENNCTLRQSNLLRHPQNLRVRPHVTHFITDDCRPCAFQKKRSHHASVCEACSVSCSSDIPSRLMLRCRTDQRRCCHAKTQLETVLAERGRCLMLRIQELEAESLGCMALSKQLVL